LEEQHTDGPRDGHEPTPGTAAAYERRLLELKIHAEVLRRDLDRSGVSYADLFYADTNKPSAPWPRSVRP
jgi:hypothetical protein